MASKRVTRRRRRFGRLLSVLVTAAALFALAGQPALAGTHKSKHRAHRTVHSATHSPAQKKTAARQKHSARQIQPAGPHAASIVVDADSGAVLHAANADLPTPPASLTKMMTLYLLFEAVEEGRLALDQRLPVSRLAANRAPTKLGVEAGDKVRVRDAINALIIISANDCATVVAEALGGSEENFARMMTNKAETIGMTQTVFRNASGLPVRGQFSTARDLAVLSQALIRDFPQYYGYFQTTEFAYGDRVYATHNRLMLRYPGADGLKTGFVRASGFNLATSAARAGRRLIGVVLGGRTARARDDRMAELLDEAFSRAVVRPDKGASNATGTPKADRTGLVALAAHNG